MTGGSVPACRSVAAREFGLIRDAEIENTIRSYAAPILNAAQLDPEAFSVHVVNSNVLNAFVAGGQRLFVTTALLRRSENAGQVIGVIAHEIGHIAGGHLARLDSAVEAASTAALISQLLGIAVGALAGNSGAAAAVGLGGAQIAERSLLKFSRTQESSADQAGITFLDHAGLSSRGLMEFLNVLSGQDALNSSRQDAYVQTHPLTRDRVLFVENHVAHSPLSNRPIPANFARMHRRMVAKLDGFLEPPSATMRRYRADDRSVAARYARAVAFYRLPDLDNALPLIDGLIAEEPGNPYFAELKGQMLFENGRLEEALPNYERAVKLLPGSSLLRTELAHVQLELNRPELLDNTIANLKEALRVDRFDSLAWQLAATAYGRKGEMGLSSLALAERNILIGRARDARKLAERAMRLLKRGEPAWLRAQDIATQPLPDRERR
jgi:predicted Zn-dependent protease